MLSFKRSLLESIGLFERAQRCFEHVIFHYSTTVCTHSFSFSSNSNAISLFLLPSQSILRTSTSRIDSFLNILLGLPVDSSNAIVCASSLVMYTPQMQFSKLHDDCSWVGLFVQITRCTCF